jgi:anti-anti-sigma factor
MSELQANLSEEDGIFVLRISGELDYKGVEPFRKALEDVFDKPDGLILECSGVEYICSAAMGVLIKYVNQSRQAGKKVVLTGVSDNDKIRNPINAVGLSKLVTIADNLDKAKQMFR